MKDNIKGELKKIFKGDVEDDAETLSKYSRDASIFTIKPKFVLFPKDSEDVKNLVKWVDQNKDKYKNPELNKDWANLSITARCAGTDMSGGAIGESLILDFTRYMNKLVSFEGDKITVQPGMFYRDFEKITLEKGLILPSFTASKSINAMGGMLGNNSAGERTLKYGQTEDYIEAQKIVFSDGNEYKVKAMTENELVQEISKKDKRGEIYKNIFSLINKDKDEIMKAKPNVKKNSAGYYIWNVVGSLAKNSSSFTLPGVPGGTYAVQNSLQVNKSLGNFFDLNKLLVGSQGTLGITTEITFRLVPNPKYSKLIVIFMKDLEPLGRLVDEILQLRPETLEAYDDKTMKLAVRFFPDFLKNKGLFEMIRFIWGFLPEFFIMITSGFPKLILLAEFSGKDEMETEDKCVLLQEKIKNFKLKTHITESGMEANKYWDIRRESFALLRKHVKGKHTAPFIDDIIVRPEFLFKFLPELNKILNEYKLTYTIAGHAGDGNFHIIPLMDFKRSDTAKIIMELGERVYDLVKKYHGSITAEHNDGLIRTPYLNKMYTDKIIQIFKEIKQIFDPKNIFNPGKKVAIENGAGTKEYLASHIAVEHTTIHKI